MSLLAFEFFCGLRGFQVYKEVWKPKLSEKIKLRHEKNNPHDINAVASVRKIQGMIVETIVGHLPREISRYTRYIIMH